MEEQKNNIISENQDSFEKDIIVATKHVDYNYKDDRNVISVIINAISVRINMPRGIIKLLMACFIVLLAAVSIYGINVLLEQRNSFYKSAEYRKAVDAIKDGVTRGADSFRDVDQSREIVLPEKEVVISENYSFIVPAGYFDEYTFAYGYLFMNMQSYGFYNSDGDYFVASSYITREGIADKDLRTVVLDRLKEANDVRNIRYEEEEFEFGDLVVIRYEGFATGMPGINAIEYSWKDDDGTICSLDIATDTGDIEKTAKQILATVHRTKGGLTNNELIARETELYLDGYPEGYDPDDPVGMGEVDPYSAMRPDMDEIRNQEAMEAWKNYINEPEKPDISDGVIKP